MKFTKKHIPWIPVLLGTLFRLVQYLSNRNMTIDESNYALLFEEMSFKEILLEFKFPYPAPYGFIAIQKSLASLIANNEYVLRFYPLLAGILSLFLLNRIKDHFTKSWGGVVALSLFATCPYVIYYSSLGKPYSSDVLIALWLTWLGLRIHASQLKYKSIILFGLGGAIATWFSFPAIFVLSAIFLACVREYIQNKEWRNLKIFALISMIGALGFVFHYFCEVPENITSSKTWTFWFKHKNPLIFEPSSLFSYIKWGLSSFDGIFVDPAGLSLPFLGIFFFFLGCYAIFASSKFKFLLLVLPILLTAAATIAKKYPFNGRLILFLLPSLFLLIGAGWEYFYNQEKRFNKKPFISFLLLILLLFPSFQRAFNNLVDPIKSPEIKQVMLYIKEHMKKGDAIYIHTKATTPFKYYQKRIKIPSNVIVAGSPEAGYNPDKTVSDINQLSKLKRAWIIFGPINAFERRRIFYLVNQKARRRRNFRAKHSSCHLFEFF